MSGTDQGREAPTPATAEARCELDESPPVVLVGELDLVATAALNAALAELDHLNSDVVVDMRAVIEVLSLAEHLPPELAHKAVLSDRNGGQPTAPYEDVEDLDQARRQDDVG